MHQYLNPDMGGNEVTHLSPLLISFASSNMPLPQDMNYFVSLSHIRPQACLWVSLSLLECHGPGWDYASSFQRGHNSTQLPDIWCWSGSWLVRRYCWRLIASPGCDPLSFTSPQNFFYIQGCSTVVDSDATNFLPPPLDKL